MTLTQIIDIPESRQITLPREIPTGKMNVIFFPVKENTTIQQPSAEKTEDPPKRREMVYHTGKFWMADDFDAPLDDFKDYM